MKTKNKFFLSFLVLTMLFNCESDDKIVDQVTQDTLRGAILRTVSIESGVFDAFDPSSVFSVTLEVEDHANGDLLESVDVFATFTDNNTEDGDNSASEVSVGTIPADAFSPGRFGLPVSSYSVSLGEVANALGLSSDDYSGGDSFAIRFEINLTDGRSYSVDDANGGIRFGSFFSSPYRYTVNLVCTSNLDVEFDWVATNFFFQGSSLGDLGSPSGTDTLVGVTDNTYTYGSGFFDFGYYCVVYNGEDPGCGDGANGTLRLQDVCGTLSYLGADQFGDPWTISNVSVSGSNWTFTWESAFGERSTVTLTRTDGMDWPMLE